MIKLQMTQEKLRMYIIVSSVTTKWIMKDVLTSRQRQRSGKMKDSVTFTQKITRKEKPATNIRWDEEKIQIYQQIH